MKIRSLWVGLLLLACVQGESKSAETTSQSQALGAGEAQLSAAERFDAWLQKYLDVAPTDRAALEAQGLVLAQQRKAEVLELMQQHPEQAFRNAVPIPVRAMLPAAIARQIERFVDARGDYEIFGGLGESGPLPFEHWLQFRGDATRYQVHTWGRRLQHASVLNGRFHAIVLDDRAVLSDSPMRKLFAGEVIDESLQQVNTRCPTSKKAIDAAQRFNTVEAVEGFCVADHAALRELVLLDEEGNQQVLSAWTVGNKSLLFIRVDFSDKPGDPATDAAVDALMGKVNAFMQANSYGKTSITTTKTPTLRMANVSTSYSDQTLRTEARAKALAAGFDTANYALEILGFVKLNHFSFKGKGAVGAKSVWLNAIPTEHGVASHELGHNFGARHANLWAAGQSIYGPGTVTEYGNPFDTMGNTCEGPECHYNMYYKRMFDWVPTSEIQTVTTSGTYQVVTAEDAITSGIHGLRISRGDGDVDYWVEFRGKFNALKVPAGTPTAIDTSALIVRGPLNIMDDRGTMMLDTNVTSTAKADAPLPLGKTFSDTHAGIHITPISRSTAASPALSVVVNLGAFTNNQAPTVSLVASATNVAANTPVTLTATASDPDGDPLTYHWEIPTLSQNQAVVTTQSIFQERRWCRVTVSDMKGKTASAAVLVNFGNPTNMTLAGTVTLNGQPMAGVIVSDGLRYTLTTTNGAYLLPRSVTGNVTMVASKTDYVFTPSFGNPINVTASQTGLDFTAVLNSGYTVSGNVSDNMSNRIVSQVSDGQRSVTTNTMGVFSITGVPSGRYTYAVTAPGWAFSQPNGTNVVDVFGADVATSFVPLGVVLSGTIFQAGSGTITVSDGIRTRNTFVAGQNLRTWAIYGVPQGPWSITAASSSTTFTPSNFTNPVMVGTTAIPNLDFTGAPGTTYTITGYAKNAGQPLSGVTVTTPGKTATTNAAGQYTLTGLTAGTYTLTATHPMYMFNPATRQVIVAGNTIAPDFVTTTSNQAPTIATAAASSASPTTGTMVTLTALGANDNGEAALTYTWATPKTPAPTFSRNGTNAAKSTVVTFTGAGSHVFTVTVRDAGGLTVTSQVTVVVTAQLNTVTVTPANAFVATSATRQFTAAGADQFMQPMTLSGTTWSTSGGGTITNAGLFTAGTTAGGPFTVTATSGTKSGTATVSVQPPGAPSITVGAAATPSPVTGKTSTLSVTATDSNGEPALTYTWAMTAGPEAVTFAPNGTNAAKSSVVTFSRAGTYTLAVTVTDGDGLQATDDVTVVVQQTPTSVEVLPPSVSLGLNQHQQFAATVIDQFDDPTALPVTWSVMPNEGTISTTGDYTASTVGGPFVVRATRNSIVGTASVTVTMEADTQPPTVSITAPSSGMNVTGVIFVAAMATDNGTIAGVEFFVDGLSIGTASSDPYAVQFDTSMVAMGAHVLTAKATDAANNVGTSDPVSVIVGAGVQDNESPTVSITSPVDMEKVKQTFTVEMKANDDVGVTAVELLVDDEVAVKLDKEPWSTSVTLKPGTHTLTARAADASGKSKVSDGVLVTVEGGCGCQSSDASSTLAWGSLLVLLLARRRRV